ncbi:MAG: hypothetical protein WAO71_08760 [Gallionella sp.]
MRHLITLACLVAAFAAYTVGWRQGIVGFAVIGIILESLFWFRLLRKKKPQSPAAHP